jgi:flagellar secretion chaperone FliS
MIKDNPLRSYQKIATQTASPGLLILQLYDGAIRFLERALGGFQHRDPLDFNVTINNNIIRAQEIINHLNDSLDLDRGGELAITLRRLYDYLHRRLNQSNVHKSPEGIRETLTHLTELRDAWQKMLRRHNDVRAAPEPFAPVLS